MTKIQKLSQSAITLLEDTITGKYDPLIDQAMLHIGMSLFIVGGYAKTMLTLQKIWL